MFDHGYLDENDLNYWFGLYGRDRIRFCAAVDQMFK